MTHPTNGRMATQVRTTEPTRADMTLGDLLAEMTREFGELVRKEAELAKLEMRDEVRRASRAGAMFAVAGIAGFLTLAFVSSALAFLLDEVMHPALACLIVGALWASAALILVSMARQRARSIDVLPETTQTLKEDVQWARAQTS